MEIIETLIANVGFPVGRFDISIGEARIEAGDPNKQYK